MLISWIWKKTFFFWCMWFGGISNTLGELHPASRGTSSKHKENTHNKPAPIAQWLVRRGLWVGRSGVWIRSVMWDFSALAGSYPELGVLWAQWEGWNNTAELHPLHGCVFDGVALITWPTLQVPQFPGLVNTRIIMTVNVICGPVK